MARPAPDLSCTRRLPCMKLHETGCVFWFSLPCPLTPYPSGTGQLGSKPLWRGGPGLGVVPCPLHPLPVAEENIYAYFFFSFRKCFANPLCLPDPTLGGAPQSCQLREARREDILAVSTHTASLLVFSSFPPKEPLRIFFPHLPPS